MTPLDEKLVFNTFSGWGLGTDSNFNLSEFDNYNLTQFYYEKAYDYNFLGQVKLFRY